MEGWQRSGLWKSNWITGTRLLANANDSYQVLTVETLVRKFLVKALVSNTGVVSLGPNNYDMSVTLNPGEEFSIDSAPGTCFDLSVWYAVSTASGEYIKLWWQL